MDRRNRCEFSTRACLANPTDREQRKRLIDLILATKHGVVRVTSIAQFQDALHATPAKLVLATNPEL